MKPSFAIIIGILIMVAAGGGTLYFKAQADAMERGTTTEAEAELLVVDVFDAAPQERFLTLHRRGMLHGIQEVLVSAEVEGAVVAKPVREGQRIRTGETLCQIDPTFHQFAVQEAQGHLEQAEAVYSNAEDEVARVNELDEEQRRPIELSRLISARDQAKAARDQASTRLEQAREILSRCNIVSPIEGVVSAVYFEIGELLGPARPVAEIVRLDEMKLVVDLTDLEIAQLGDQPQIKVSSSGHAGRAFAGRINAVYPKADLQTRRIPIEVRVANQDLLLRSGTMVDCTIESRVPDDKMLIPAKAVLDEFGAEFCYLARKQQGVARVHRQAVSTLPVAGSVRWKECTAGLQYGDRLILSHQQELRPGQQIAVRATSLNDTPLVSEAAN